MFMIAGSIGFAQTVSTSVRPVENTDSSTRADSASAVSTSSAEIKPELKKNESVKPILGIKSYSDFARFENRNDDASKPTGGQVLNAKLDLYAGYVGKAGWGAIFDIAQYRQEYNDSNLDKWAFADPYISLVHPDFYNDDTFRLYGFFRTYIPFTNRSKSLNIHHHAYYSEMSYELGAERLVENEFVPRFFVADHYAADDVNFMVEDTVTVTQRLGHWGRVGLGNWFQMEQHSQTPTGYTSELFPYFDYLIGKTAYVGSRIYLPIYAKNIVWDGPTHATTNQARLELYFQAGL